MNTNAFLRLRAELQWSQGRLGDRLGCRQQLISQYERGLKVPGLRTAYALIDLYSEAGLRCTLEDVYPRDVVTQRGARDAEAA